MGARAFIPMALAGAVLFTLAPSSATPVAAAEPTTEAQQIIKIARQQTGDPWRHSATGPKAFDCSGLVTYAYRKAGDLKVIGNGKYRSARALYHYFKARGLADRKNPKPGDLVIWGNGTHVGIYIGDGKAISTLTSGVRIHKINAVTARFTAYLHTGMWKKSTGGGSIALANQKTPVTKVFAIGDVRHRTVPVTTTIGPAERLTD
jgi:cell wall-associated NlpC family hydrolase